MADSNIRGERDEADSTEQEEDVSNPLIKIAHSVWNFELLSDARNDFVQVDWFLVSITTFYLGIVGLSLWSLVMFLSYILNYITSSAGFVSGASRFLQVGPWFPVVLFLFAVISRWAVNNLQESKIPDDSVRGRGLLFVFLISVIALIVAAIFRWAIFYALADIYGSSLTKEGVMGAMFLDGLYISLLLIGVGGLSSIIFEPNHSTDE